MTPLDAAIAAAVKEIAALARKVGAAFFAFLAGKKAGKEKAEKKQRKETDRAREEQAEKDQEFERRKRDASERDRVRDAIDAANKPDG